MIATCPACATRYVVDPAALGRQGRTVRCAKCRNTWHLEAPEDVLAEAEEEEVQRPPRYIPGMDVPPAAPAEEPDSPPQPDAAPDGETSVEKAARTTSSLRAPQRNLPAVRKSSGRQMVIAWGALAVALIIFLGILIGLREPISRSIPALAGLYDAVGLGGPRSPVKEPQKKLTAADALAFVSLGLKLENEGGVPVLTVTGQIKNATEQSFDLPPIKATLLDGSKEELYSWNFDPPAASIAPMQSLAFSSRLSNPPTQVREAVLTFTSDSPVPSHDAGEH